MKIITDLLGLEFIKHKPTKNAARLLVNVGLVLASQTPQGAAILALLGLTPGMDAAAIVAGGAAVIEAIRTSLKQK